MVGPLTDEAGFVLHSRPYRETSLIVDLFLRERGRVSAVAKGARRPTSALRPVLLQFQPIDFRLSGRHELRTLTRAEWQGGMAVPGGRALLFAFYLNELVIRLLAREDPHPQLFDAYTEALHQLGERGADERILRRFEWLLLAEIGYAPDLQCDHQGIPLHPARNYRINEGQWFVTQVEDYATFNGQILQHIASGRYDAPGVLAQAKRLSRLMLALPLEGASLDTRRILMDLQRL
ncbi:MAG: DNA repair protein RecO [Lautropia sp.]|nr:DNA repair protein RecO [Lautropia sp.]